MHLTLYMIVKEYAEGLDEWRTYDLANSRNIPDGGLEMLIVPGKSQFYFR